MPEHIKQIKTYITRNSSTSFVECDLLPLRELVDFYVELREQIDEMYKSMNGGGGNGG